MSEQDWRRRSSNRGGGFSSRGDRGSSSGSFRGGRGGRGGFNPHRVDSSSSLQQPQHAQHQQQQRFKREDSSRTSVRSFASSRHDSRSLQRNESSYQRNEMEDLSLRDWSFQVKDVSGMKQGDAFENCKVTQVVPGSGTLVQLTPLAGNTEQNEFVIGLVEQFETSGRNVVLERVRVRQVLPNGMVLVDMDLKTPDANAPLIILDLNGVLVARPSFRDRKQNKSYTKRPFCDDFIKFCFENFFVGVWSCGKRKTMEMELFEPYKDRILFQWDQENSTNLWPRTSVVSKEKPLFLKEVTKVWEAFPGRFGPENTLLIDNHAEKFERNPIESCILVREFSDPFAFDDALAPDRDLTCGLKDFVASTGEDRMKARTCVQSVLLRERFAALFTSSVVMQQNCPERDVNFYMRSKDIPGPRAKPFRRRILNEILKSHTSWRVCEKSNGIRHMLIAFPSNGPVYVVNRAWHFTYVGRNIFPSEGWTLIDGEFVSSRDSSTMESKMAFLLFDVIWLNGKDVGAEPELDKRMEAWAQFVSQVQPDFRSDASHSKCPIVSLESLQIITKVFHSVADIEKPALSVNNHTYDVVGSVECDGLVFTPVYSSYYEYTVVKFKPVDELTVDFRILKSSLPGEPGLQDGEFVLPLFLLEYPRMPSGRGGKPLDVQVGEVIVTQEQQSVIQQSQGYDVIAECAFDASKGFWRVRLFRLDKERPNSLATGWSVLESVAEHVTVEDLTKVSKEYVSQHPDPPLARGSNKVNPVAKHYNERQMERNRTNNALDLRIENLRKLNNWSKAVLIHDCCVGELDLIGDVPLPQAMPRIPKELVGNPGRVDWKSARNETKRPVPMRILDLACGRGGDLNKWQVSSDVESFVGVDIAAIALQEARERVGNKANFSFVESDMSDLRLLEHPSIKDNQFDVVSIQFAFHYICESLERCSNLFKICQAKLKARDVNDPFEPLILITTTDHEMLHRRSPLFTNNVCKVEFTTPLPKETQDIEFGQSYSFSLGDAVQDCEEFVVPLHKVNAVAKQFGFELALSQNLASFVVDKIGKHTSLLHTMAVIGRKAQGRASISQDEWEAIQLYQVLVFRRTPT